MLSWCQAVRLESDGSERKSHWTGLNQTKDAHQGSPVQFKKILLNFWALLAPPPLHGPTLLCMGGLVSPHRLYQSQPLRYLKDFSFKHWKCSHSCYFLSIAETNVMVFTAILTTTNNEGIRLTCVTAKNNNNVNKGGWRSGSCGLCEECVFLLCLWGFSRNSRSNYSFLPV